LSGRVKFKDFLRTFKAMYQQIQALNTEENTLETSKICRGSILIFLYNSPPPWGGGKESKDLRAREENQSKKSRKNGKTEGKEEKNFVG
jgi:hypothetical protein